MALTAQDVRELEYESSLVSGSNRGLALAV